MPARRATTRATKTTRTTRRYKPRGVGGSQARSTYTRKRYRKVGRTYGRTRTRGKALALRPKWEDPLAPQASIKLRYEDLQFDLSTEIGNVYFNHHVFTGNKPYDPDYTGVGVQPYGYDQMMNADMYRRYYCMGSKITVRFYTAFDVSHHMILTLVPSNSNTITYTDPDDLKVLARCKQLRADTTRSSNWTMSQYCTTHAMYPAVDTRDVDFVGSYDGTGPSYVWYWHIFADTSALTEETALAMDVQITYYIRAYRTDDASES